MRLAYGARHVMKLFEQTGLFPYQRPPTAPYAGCPGHLMLLKKLRSNPEGAFGGTTGPQANRNLVAG